MKLKHYFYCTINYYNKYVATEKVNKPIARVRYELEEIGYPKLIDILKERGFL